MKKCLNCHVEFIPTRSNNLFCTKKCLTQDSYKRNRKQLICKNCNKIFIANKRKVYCSSECIGISRLNLNRKNRQINNEMVGKRFNKLIVIQEYLTQKRKNDVQWICICDCGKKTIKNSSGLRSGKHISCGCSKKSKLIRGQ